MKQAFIYGPILLIVLFTGFFYGRLSSTPKPTDFSVASEQSQLDYINKIRADHKIPALRYDAGLDKTAILKVQDMIKRHYWAHTTPDGERFYILAEKIRPGLKYYGENLGECFKSNDDLFAAYTASEEHLTSIIDPHYSLFGAATLWDDQKHCFINSNEFGG